MNIPVEEPIETVKTGPTGGVEVTHPAFASIRASRVSGSTNLYASDFNHQHYVTVSIMRSSITRSLSSDWHHGREELIEVAMSESQWAHFVSSMNVGSGAPCTLTRIAGGPNYGMVNRLPPPKPKTDLFAAEMNAVMADSMERIKDISDSMTSAKKIGAVREIKLELENILKSLKGSSVFVADQFDEHIERTVNQAKTEINDYAMNAVVNAGLETLGVPIKLPQIE